jgi:hypothetical protein
VSETLNLGADRFLPPDALDAGRGPLGRGDPRSSRADAFANTSLRTVDVRYQIPLARLGPGPHLLTFRTTAGGTPLRRDVRFAVR